MQRAHADGVCPFPALHHGHSEEVGSLPSEGGDLSSDAASHALRSPRVERLLVMQLGLLVSLSREAGRGGSLSGVVTV